MEFFFREATMDDTGDIALLNIQLGYPLQTAVLKQHLQKVLSLPANFVFVAEYNKKVIGWMNVRIVHTIESGTNCEIYGLIVDENFRNKGIGKTFIARAKEWAAQNGAGKLRVRTNVKRLSAHRFYYREGFKETKEQKSLELNL